MFKLHVYLASVGLIIIQAVGFVLTIGVTSTYAYLDPVSGSMIAQLVFGGIAGVAVVLKLYWRSLRDKVFRLLKVGSKQSKQTE